MMPDAMAPVKPIPAEINILFLILSSVLLLGDVIPPIIKVPTDKLESAQNEFRAIRFIFIALFSAWRFSVWRDFGDNVVFMDCSAFSFSSLSAMVFMLSGSFIFCKFRVFMKPVIPFCLIFMLFPSMWITS